VGLQSEDEDKKNYSERKRMQSTIPTIIKELK
jgi:hypothetical protein